MKEMRKAKKKRPPTPTKKGEALESNFGRQPFKETQDIQPETSSEESSEDESSSSQDSKVELPPIPGVNTTVNPGLEPTLVKEPTPVAGIPKAATPKVDPVPEKVATPVQPPAEPPAEPAPEDDPTRIQFNPAPREDPLTMTGASLVARDIHTLGSPAPPKEEEKKQ